MSAEDAEMGWSSGHGMYLCADGTEVCVKRQETVKFTREEQVERSWERYNEILFAVGPRNGVVHKIMSKEMKGSRE